MNEWPAAAMLILWLGKLLWATCQGEWTLQNEFIEFDYNMIVDATITTP